MMAAKSFFRPLMLGSFVALVSLLAAPAGTSMTWATSHETPQMMHKKPVMKTPTAATAATASPQMLTDQQPTTLDSYIDYVSNRLQVEAMKVKHEGSADVQLTIDKSGAVKLAEVVRVNGPAALRDEVMGMVRMIGSLPPLPPDANADVLVLTSQVVFNYPGREMFDRYGDRTSGRR
jgi:outer membrane biosynthesis protein TonB